MFPERRTEPALISWMAGPPAEGGPALPPGQWLSPAELERLARFRAPKRRDDWLLGRLVAKRLLCRELSAREGRRVPLPTIEIVPDITGAPHVRAVDRGATLPVSITISHSAGRALGALLFTDLPECVDCTVGADLEKVEARADGFIRDFLTEAERAEVASLEAPARPARANGIWSAKEAVLKTLKLGLTVDTWRVECLLAPREVPEPGPFAPEGPPWRRFSIRCAPEILPGVVGGTRLLGFWREEAGYVLTLAVARV